MYTTQNGWTKDRMKEAIRAGNNGKKAGEHDEAKDTFACRYKTSDGNRCAVGCFIPEGHRAESNISTAMRLFTEMPELCALMPLDAAAMDRFQCAHDDGPDEGVHQWLFAWIDANVEDAPYTSGGPG